MEQRYPYLDREKLAYEKRNSKTKSESIVSFFSEGSKRLINGLILSTDSILITSSIVERKP